MSTLVFDTETTGLDSPEVIEAAWLEVESPQDLHVKDSFYARYRPEGAISYGAMATHHILPEDLEGCPPSREFRLPEGVEYLIGHNVDFDWEVAGRPQVRRICTLAMARRVWPGLDSHKQEALCYMLAPNKGVMRKRLRSAHSAVVDVELCLEILETILQLHPLASWEQVWEFSEDARVPTHFTFGKHKGMRIQDAPGDYKRWFLRQPDVDPYLRKALLG